MTKDDLEQIISLKSEEKDLIRRMSETKESVITDNVKASSKSYPYIQHNCVIEGIDYKKQLKDKKYRRMIRQKQENIAKRIREAEHWLNNVESSEIRQIIRHIYFDGKDYNQTAHLMNRENPRGKYTADSIRMKLKRFFEKI